MIDGSGRSGSKTGSVNVDGADAALAALAVLLAAGTSARTAMAAAIRAKRPNLRISHLLSWASAWRASNRCSESRIEDHRAVAVITVSECAGNWYRAPIGYATYTSLFTSKLIGGTTFSGLSNYSQVLTTGEFWSGVEW